MNIIQESKISSKRKRTRNLNERECELYSQPRFGWGATPATHQQDSTIILILIINAVLKKTQKFPKIVTHELIPKMIKVEMSDHAKIVSIEEKILI